jgi:hypothetical protein
MLNNFGRVLWSLYFFSFEIYLNDFFSSNAKKKKESQNIDIKKISVHTIINDKT